MLFIILFIVISYLNNKEVTIYIELIEETGEIIKRTEVEENVTTKGKKLITIVIMSIMILFWLILLFLWISDYIRLFFRTECSYNEFEANEKKRQLKHPIRYGLNVVGHDKYGFPILGKQIGNIIKIRGVKDKFEEKINEKINYSGKYFDENGKINIRYYSYMTQKPINKEKLEEKMNEKEKYIEKYYDGENGFQNYTNFENKTILNLDDNNNSINPGYEI